MLRIDFRFHFFSKTSFSIFEKRHLVVSIFRHRQSILFDAENFTFQLLIDFQFFYFFKKIYIFAPACNSVGPIQNLNGLLQQNKFTMHDAHEVSMKTILIKSEGNIDNFSKILIFQKKTFFPKLKVSDLIEFGARLTLTPDR